MSGRRRPRSWHARAAGHTFVELLVVTVVLGIVAAATLPVASVMHRREKEIRLRRALREIRTALDAYHQLCRASAGRGGGGQRPQQGVPTLTIAPPEDDPNLDCWPKDLDLLVEGVETSVPDYKLRFLRSIPRDPFVAPDEENDAYGWILRSPREPPDSTGGWDRTLVYDVRSASEAQSLDGSYYKDW